MCVGGGQAGWSIVALWCYSQLSPCPDRLTQFGCVSGRPGERHAALGERQLRASMKRLERKYSAVDKRSDKRRPAALSSLLHLCFTGVDGKQTAAVLVLASLSCTLHRSRPLSGLRSSARRCLIYLPSLRTLTWLTQAPFSPNIT